MNTEIIDYIKTLSKKEFFYVSLANLVFSLTILICGGLSLAGVFADEKIPQIIMFGCATALLALNSYKCFKRGSKNGFVFAILSVVFAAVTVICILGPNGGQ